MNSFGCAVTLVELMDRILPLEDSDSSKALEREFKKKGIKVLTSARAMSAEKKENAISIVLERNGAQERVEADKMLVCVGRSPATGDLGLKEAGIAIDAKGFIVVDADYRTSNPAIYAIGDCINTPLLAHVASHEGLYAVEKIAGKNPEKQTMGLCQHAPIPGRRWRALGQQSRSSKQRALNTPQARPASRQAAKRSFLEKTQDLSRLLLKKRQARYWPRIL